MRALPGSEPPAKCGGTRLTCRRALAQCESLCRGPSTSWGQTLRRKKAELAGGAGGQGQDGAGTGFGSQHHPTPAIPSLWAWAADVVVEASQPGMRSALFRCPAP